MRFPRLALLFASAALSACGSPEDASAPTASTGTLVGTLEGTDARVGLVLGADKGVLYVCGGDLTRASLTRWFTGARTASGIDWQTGDLRVVASPSGSGFAGQITKADGSAAPYKFVVAPVASGTSAGLYDASLPEGRAGVVVFQSSASEPATILGAFKTTAGTFEQVLPVREVLRTADGIEVTVAGIAKTFFVKPVTP